MEVEVEVDVVGFDEQDADLNDCASAFIGVFCNVVQEAILTLTSLVMQNLLIKVRDNNYDTLSSNLHIIKIKDAHGFLTTYD